MNKILLFLASLIFAFSISSCKKCYHCEKSIVIKDLSGADSTAYYKTDFCSQGKEGAGSNLKLTVEDVEKNGYTCTVK